MAMKTSVAIGGNAVFRVASEVDYGEFVPPTHRIRFNSETMARSENTLQSEAITGDRGLADIVRSGLVVGGDLVKEIEPSGMGILVRHALGDYVRFYNTNGGIRARVQNPTAATVDAGDATLTALPVSNAQIIHLTDESTLQFEDDGYAVFTYRSGPQRVLTGDDNTGLGHSYSSMTYFQNSYVVAVNDAATVPGGTDTVVSIDLATNNSGSNIEAAPFAGLLRYGPQRRLISYFGATDLGAGLGTRVYLDLTQVPPADPGSQPVVGDVVMIQSTMVHNAGFSPSFFTNLQKGSFLYEFSSDYTDANGEIVYTHHIERGRRLPVGLSIEVDKDAATFVFTGNRIGSMACEFATDSILTATFTFSGQRPFSIARLEVDAIPGATEIFIRDQDHVPFPSTAGGGGVITIGESTDILYTTKEVNYNNTGLTRLSGIAATGDQAIDKLHPRGQNVDNRTSRVVDNSLAGEDIETVNSPLTSFQSYVYINGYYKEVLAASLTLENTLNTDKRGLGSFVVFATPEQDAIVTGNLSLEFDDGQYLVRWYNGEFFPIDIRCISNADDAEIGLTGVPAAMYFFMPRVRLTGDDPTIAGKEIVNYDTPFSATPDKALDTTDLIVTIVNSVINDCAA